MLMKSKKNNNKKSSWVICWRCFLKFISSSFLIPLEKFFLDYCLVKMRIEARKEKSFCVFIDFQYFSAFSALLNKVFTLVSFWSLLTQFIFEMFDCLFLWTFSGEFFFELKFDANLKWVVCLEVYYGWSDEGKLKKQNMFEDERKFFNFIFWKISLDYLKIHTGSYHMEDDQICKLKAFQFNLMNSTKIIIFLKKPKSLEHYTQTFP